MAEPDAHPPARPAPVPEAEARTPPARGFGEGADTAVAVLLAVAAVIVAVVGGRAALVGDAGSDTWHSAVREDVKRAAAIVEDVRFLYQEEVPLAFQVEEAAIRGRELERESRRASGTVKRFLEARSKAQAKVAEPVERSSSIASDPRYSPDERGVLLRLADRRARYPDLAALDPDGTESRGSDLGLESSLLIGTTILAAVAFMLGALAEGFVSHRRVLVAAGYALAGMSLIAAVVVEASF